ncbi:Reticulon-domain-containing protein [Ilyonectria sp. MPI-CAGE-AT-0026]|nr:Reticulon-domain-containing protein [Ilyonectria sp. MPI-CAGE-AT-0026]
MSGPAYVMPVQAVQADGAQHFEPVAPAIHQSLSEKPQPEDHGQQEDLGPLSKIIANQDSLYKYISWEDPGRTLGSYALAMSILCAAHYVPLTRLALKAVATSLGVISLTEFAGRCFGPNTFLTRLRPAEYYKVQESTLNATLQDIHDFVQYAVVKAQKLIFAENLDQTFAAFIGLTSLYWLIKIVPPFGLAVLGLTSVYMAPLFTSPRAREVAHNTTVRAGELASAAAEKGNSLAQDSKAQAVDLASKAQQTGIDMKRRIDGSTQNGRQTDADLYTHTRSIDESTQRARQTGADLSSQPRSFDGNKFETGLAVNNMSEFSNTDDTAESMKGTGPAGIVDTTHHRHPASDPLQNPMILT